ncbi:CDK-activating kinase assembly factor [Westerdykella ornata]|uniref:RNA polymerase II transcription factor B subunit 3 n=1 Tax=Westerdykella ornata TaxID=318751 RepID=A0A6A6JBH8_WESOR|nr:CDK-activating kinase assembly factor [Westerdykella ornata]KAF2273617.1 CDK-activating kinase assembly factor [Westerdykella ornata]
MSKAASRVPGGGAAKDEAICPVCKSSRYLNPNMRFLVNPECYHKMCESCVDRIFSHGPAPCPIAGCKRTLRKAKFRTQTFEDLKVEREVDIRRRVARVLNKTEADFETLRDYNDYLETVEEITWNLILKIDVEATEKRLRLYEEAQKAERNITARPYQPDPSLPSEKAQVVLKKGASQRKAVATSAANTPDSRANPQDGEVEKGFNFHGLKKYVPPAPEKPLDPFDGWAIEPQFYVVQDDYDVEWLTQTKNDPVATAGGYDMRDFYSRALCDAFSGFGVFVEDEIEARAKGLSGDANTGTRSAATAALGGKDVNMDDVF